MLPASLQKYLILLGKFFAGLTPSTYNVHKLYKRDYALAMIKAKFTTYLDDEALTAVTVSIHRQSSLIINS